METIKHILPHFATTPVCLMPHLSCNVKPPAGMSPSLSPRQPSKWTVKQSWHRPPRDGGDCSFPGGGGNTTPYPVGGLGGESFVAFVFCFAQIINERVVSSVSESHLSQSGSEQGNVSSLSASSFALSFWHYCWPCTGFDCWFSQWASLHKPSARSGNTKSRPWWLHSAGPPGPSSWTWCSSRQPLSGEFPWGRTFFLRIRAQFHTHIHIFGTSRCCS